MNRTKRGEVYEWPGNKFTFVCVHCSDEFQQFTDFTSHVQTHLHLDVKSEAPSLSDWNDSDQQSTSGPIDATRTIKNLQESDDDDGRFTDHFTESADIKADSSASESRHIQRRRTSSSHKRFECFICHKKLTSSFVVRRHMMRIHRHNDLNCKYCNTKFRTSRYLERHNCMSHPDRARFVSQMPITDRPIEPARTYECAVCKRIFRDRRQLQSHMTKHKQSPCLCLICGKIFSGDRTLARHMKLHATTGEIHPCTECGRKFKQRRYLLDHNRKVHNLYADDGPAICDTCDQQFDNKRLLHIHMQTHPFVEKRKFPCTLCNHWAKCAYDLRRHIETHSMENRSFVCPICDKKLLPRYANDHMKSHDPTLNFECNECGKQFKRAKTLKRHQNTHRTASDSGTAYKCDVCTNTFARMDGLLRHRRRHSVPMNYHCRTCGKGFIEEKSFRLHEANHTKGNFNNTTN